MAAAGTLVCTAAVNGVASTLTPQRGVTDWTLVWTSDASGNVTQNTPVIVGQLIDVTYIPGTGGVQPTDAYDLTLKNPAGTDVLNGSGANLSQTNTTQPSVPMKTTTDGTTAGALPRWLSDILSLAVTNAGNAKSGTIILRVMNP